MRKINSKVRTNFISEEGTFLQNKDYFAFVELDDHACYVIADGLDDDREMESAQIVVTNFIKDFTDKPTMNKYIIRKYIKNANAELIKQSNNVRLKASITVVITNYSKLFYCAVGNTRFYYFKEGLLRLKSKDDSLTEEMAEKGLISLDRVSEHIERNNLSSYLGENKISTPYTSKKIKLADGDVFALLTRGIWENCDENEMEDALEGAKNPEDVVDDVEEMILSKQPLKIENYTLALTFFDKVYINPNRKKTIKTVIFAAIPILIAIITIVVLLNIKMNKKKESIAAMNNSIVYAQGYIDDNNVLRANEEYNKANDIAEKYKMGPESDETGLKLRYTELILDADKKLDDKKYEEAIEQYKIALDKSSTFDNLCKEYIENKIVLANNCIKTVEFLELGNTDYENRNYVAAELNYKSAKDYALKSFLNDERKEAIDMLKQISDARAALDQESKNKEAEDTQKAEEFNQKGMTLMQTGDTQYLSGDFLNAKNYYNLAKTEFQSAKNNRLVDRMTEKIENIDDLIDTKKTDAEQYVKEAKKSASSNNIEAAKESYRKAQEIYESLQLLDEVKIIQKQLEALN